MKVLISGGWGYANLGDDAILASTIDLIKEKYPKCEITIMSFNPSETREIVPDERMKIVRSINRHLSKSAFKTLQISKNPHFEISTRNIRHVFKLPRKIRGLVHRLNQFILQSKYLAFRKAPALLPCIQYFKEADLFIQAGGGYFIESWKDSFYARILELLIAEKYGARILVIGQSIGPFTNRKCKQLAIEALNKANVLSVRDTESYYELKSYGLNPTVIPDTVLSKSDFKYKKIKSIAVLLGSKELSEQQVDSICGSLIEISKGTGVNIKITVSRRWDTDIRNVFKLYRRLKLRANTKLILPNSYIELQDILGECEVIISQNLHGLILAWRAGCACISINDKRKFVSFMHQSKQSNRLLPLQYLSKDKLTRLINDALSTNFSEMESIRHKLAKEISKEFNTSIEEALKD